MSALQIQSIEITDEEPSLIQITFDEADVVQDININYDEFSVSAGELAGIMIRPNSNSGDNSARRLCLALKTRVFSGDALTLSFTKVNNTITAAQSGKVLNSFTDLAVTNNTTQSESQFGVTLHPQMINSLAQLGYSVWTGITYTTNSQYANWEPSLLNVKNGDGSDQYLSGQKYNKYSYNDQGSFAKPEVLFPIHGDPAYIDVEFTSAAIEIDTIYFKPYYHASTNRDTIAKEIQIYARNGSFGSDISGDFKTAISIPKEWPNARRAYTFPSVGGAFTHYRFRITQTWLGGDAAGGIGHWGHLYINRMHFKAKSQSEAAAENAGISSSHISTLKAGTLTVSNGKSTLDNTRKSTLATLMQGASDAADKREKRRAALKLIFSQTTDLTRLLVPKTDLDLPPAFTKTNALVVKAGETIAVSDLGADEGFYSVLNNNETVTVATDNTALTFTRTDVGASESYTVSATSWTGIDIDSTNVASGTFTDANTTGTLVPDDSVIIDGRIFIIGSVADGGSSTTTATAGGDPFIQSLF